MQPVIVRSTRPDDEATLLMLATEFATSFTIDAAVFHESFAELLAAGQTYLAVAETDGHVVGYVLGFEHPTFYANGRVAWVEEITVRADLRRRGIGMLLMRRFEQWASERNCKLVALATRRADAFYEAAGYESSVTYFRKRL